MQQPNKEVTIAFILRITLLDNFSNLPKVTQLTSDQKKSQTQVSESIPIILGIVVFSNIKIQIGLCFLMQLEGEYFPCYSFRILRKNCNCIFQNITWFK